MKLHFRRYIVAWFSLSLVILLCLHFVGLLGTYHSKKKNFRADDEQEGLLIASRIRSAVSEAESAVDHFLWTNDLSAMEALENLTEQAGWELQQFHQKLQGMTGFQPKFDQLRTTTEALLRGLHTLATARKYQGTEAALHLLSKLKLRDQSLRFQKTMSDIETQTLNDIETQIVGGSRALDLTAFGSALGTLFDLVIFTAVFFSLRFEISRRRKVEMQLSSSLTDLEAANLSLKNAIELKDQFVAMAAHDLRNPLRHIHIYAQLLSREKTTSENHAEIVTFILKAASQMTALVEDLLQEAALKDGKLKIEKKLTDPAILLKKIMESQKPLLEKKSQHISMDIGNPPVLVEIDEARMLQVLTNLVSNAIKYSPVGAKIDLKVRQDDRYVYISVADTGLGISEFEKTRIFNAFFRSGKKPTGNESSTGLGLSIAKQLVEMHGGLLQVASDGPGQGSVFTIRLSRPLVVLSPSASSLAELGPPVPSGDSLNFH